MKALGIDVGMKRVGVAISDDLGWTAQGLETINTTGNSFESVYHRIQTLVDERNVTHIVVGLPKNMDGTIGDRGKQCKAFAAELEKRVNINVSLWDERLTTAFAERTLLEAGVSRKKRKQVIDKMAAVMILQSFLDRQSQMKN